MQLHYYQFNIGDYYSHTQHLDEIEDLAYRRMLDYCYLHEAHLPNSIEMIAKKIRMRTHCEAIANVLQEFFEQDEYGYFQQRIVRDIEAYKAKSEKAKASANARWAKKPYANALQPECESNANHKPITINHKPIVEPQENKFSEGDLLLANKIWQRISELQPKRKPPNIDKWADDIRKLRVINGYSLKDIADAFKWATNNEFWSTNILSTAKLRGQIDRLTLEMKKEEKNKPYNNSPFARPMR